MASDTFVQRPKNNIVYPPVSSSLIDSETMEKIKYTLSGVNIMKVSYIAPERV